MAQLTTARHICPRSLSSTLEGAMGGDFVPAEVTLFQDAFSHFDKTNSGMIPTKMLGQLLRFVGENPSDAEVQVG